MSTVSRDYIPLLHILRKLPETDRQIIISHLNHESCAHVERCIVRVLKGKRRLSASQRHAVQKCVRENQSDFSKILSSKSLSVKRKHLAKVGGGPFTLLLSIGLPLLLSFLRK